MTAEVPTKAKKVKRSRASKVFESCMHLLVLIALCPVAIATIVYFSQSDRVLSIPFVSDFAKQSLNDTFPQYEIEIAENGLSRGGNFFNPEMVMRDIVVRSDNGNTVMRIPEIRGDAGILFQHDKKGDKGILSVRGARLFLWRDVSGRFNFNDFDAGATSNLNVSLDQAIDDFLTLPFAKNLSHFELSDVSLVYRDALTKKEYTLSDGDLLAKLEGRELDVSAGFNLTRKEGKSTVLRFSARRTVGDDLTDITMKFENADPLDLADQIPALDWLRNLDADVSSSLVMELGKHAVLSSLSGVLDLGAGSVRATDENPGARFEHAKGYFSYNRDLDRLEFSNFELDTELGRVVGSANSVLKRNTFGLVTGTTFSAKVDSLELLDPKVFKDPLTFFDSTAKLEIGFDPIHVAIKRVVGKSENSTFSVSGDLWASDTEWNTDLRLRVDKLSRDQLLTAWPITAIPKTRNWVNENLVKAELFDFHGNFRRLYGDANFEFKFRAEEAVAHVVKTVPPIHDGYGNGYLTQDVFTLELDSGSMTTANGKPLELAGSRFHIPDITQRPAIGEIQLAVKGDLESTLQVLDSDKFKYISKINKPTDVAQGNVDVTGWLTVPLKKGTNQDEIELSFAGQIFDVRSEKLIEGRNLQADVIEVITSHEGMSMQGSASLDGVESSFFWNQKFIGNPTKESTLTADLAINQNALDALNIGLPRGSFSGATQAKLTVDLEPQKPASFELTSALTGASLQVPSLGWRKTTQSKGSLGVKGQLTDPVTINQITLAGNGLKTTGAVKLNDKGEFKAAEFPSLKIGNWFSSSVSIVGTGLNAVTTIKGGTIDLRRLDIGASSGERAGPLRIELDRLRLTDSLSLTNFRADIKRLGKPQGTFTASINGRSQINGQIIGRANGNTAVQIKGKDAGALLRAAGMLENIRGGALTLTIDPAKEADVYNMAFKVNNFRMIHSSAITNLLDAISLVGLIQKLEGDGISFSTAEGRALLRPEGVRLIDVALVGPSMGMTLNGWYTAASHSLDFEGVITPIYGLNGLFERTAGKLFGRQRGEGLFSFVYKIKGPVASPKISVNPFSILTPGGFREIFRQKRPQAPTK